MKSILLVFGTFFTAVISGTIEAQASANAQASASGGQSVSSARANANALASGGDGVARASADAYASVTGSGNSCTGSTCVYCPSTGCPTTQTTPVPSIIPCTGNDCPPPDHGKVPHAECPTCPPDCPVLFDLTTASGASSYGAYYVDLSFKQLCQMKTPNYASGTRGPYVCAPIFGDSPKSAVA